MNVIVILCDTFRRDHCGAYNGGKPLNQCWSKEAPDWVVPTPNLDRLAARGTVFDNCWCGSTPCMPARRDIYTGRYEFLERGWGPLEEDDLDLPRQVSGAPNRSIRKVLETGDKISYLVTDHFHLWEQGAGNYHMGYTGFDFVRGKESDAWYTAPYDGFECPEGTLMGKNERHWRNIHHIRSSEEDWFSHLVFDKASKWLEANHEYEDFYLHIDEFDPHEPLDPPEELVKMFDPAGYSEFEANNWPYAPWEGKMSEAEFQNARARYAANVVLVDRAIGRLMETMDRLDLWKDTFVIFTTDHGTFNGDHGRIGKLQTHEFDACGHIPFIMAHPTLAHGERRSQLVQLVDIYPTVLRAVGKPPQDRTLHGVDLLPVLEDAGAKTRDYAVAGQYGQSVTITDGDWVLHQAPVADNQPLNWYGHCLAKFIGAPLEDYIGGRRHCTQHYWWETETWLSDKREDPNELNNIATANSEKLAEMQRALKDTLIRLRAPAEQLDRLGIRDV